MSNLKDGTINNEKDDNNVHDDHAPTVARRMYQPLGTIITR